MLHLYQLGGSRTVHAGPNVIISFISSISYLHPYHYQYQPARAPQVFPPTSLAQVAVPLCLLAWPPPDPGLAQTEAQVTARQDTHTWHRGDSQQFHTSLITYPGIIYYPISSMCSNIQCHIQSSMVACHEMT